MIIPERHVCDLCKKNEVDNNHIGLSIPVITNCDWTEGNSEPIHVEFNTYDICEECLIKVTNVLAYFQGSNPRFRTR